MLSAAAPPVNVSLPPNPYIALGAVGLGAMAVSFPVVPRKRPTTPAGKLPSVTCNVPDTAVVCALGVRLVVTPLVIVGLPNALANGLTKESVVLSGSVARNEMDVAVTATLETVGAVFDAELAKTTSTQ